MRNTYYFELPESESTDFSITLNVGEHSLRIHFLWSFVSQEQDTILEETIARFADTDPIDMGASYDRDYDYVNYYLPFVNATVSRIEEWLTTTPHLPVSLHGLQLFKQVELVQQRATVAYEFNIWRRLYSETLIWQVTFEENDIKIVGTLRPGAMYETVDGSMTIHVESLLTSIGQNDLQNVAFRIEVEE